MLLITEFLVVLGVVGFSFYKRLSPVLWSSCIGLILVILALWGHLPGWFLWTAGLLWAFFTLFSHSSSLRKRFFTNFLFQIFKKALPTMSKTEQEALEAGDVWWEGELFRGNPDWKKWLSISKPTLTEEERAFVDDQVEKLCEMVNDWEVTEKGCDLPAHVWEYLKKERFFGMIIPKEYGGLGFSALAHSTVIVKIGTRSVTAVTNTMVPNSLGPAELLLHYGTPEQKRYYLPRLAKGEEIPCFALTGPLAGSDAGAIPDVGIVTRGQYNGKEVLGIRLTWDKRYITLAPIATVLGLAFKLFDPNHLLGDKKEMGVTLALVPTNLPGVEIGTRHHPLNIAFQNGPTRGTDVFIPIDYIIGGPEMAGKGWRMLMESLSAGRGISLPSLSTASGKLAYRMTGAYALVRRQFKMAIGQFEGVQAAMARIAGSTYLLEAARLATVRGVDLGIKPSVVTAIAKYHMTEWARKVILDAMDIHGGKGIALGPKNYLGRAYQALPISITVEGANILTRSMIIFGQGAIRCHPFILREMQAVNLPDSKEALSAFDKAFFSHVGYTGSNFIRTLWTGLTAGKLLISSVSDKPTRSYYNQLTRMSMALAFSADIAMSLLGGALKKKELISARLGDVLSYLYLASAVLKYYEDNHRPASDIPSVEWCLTTCLIQIQTAFVELCRNFPVKWVGVLLRAIIFPFGLSYHAPSDKLGRVLALDMMQDNAFRERLTQYCYIGKNKEDGTGIVEYAFKRTLATEVQEKKVEHAIQTKQIRRRRTFSETIQAALSANVITKFEASELLEAEQARFDAIAVDDFPQDYLRGELKACQQTLKTEVA